MLEGISSTRVMPANFFLPGMRRRRSDSALSYEWVASGDLATADIMREELEPIFLVLDKSEPIHFESVAPVIINGIVVWWRCDDDVHTRSNRSMELCGIGLADSIERQLLALQEVK